MTPETALIIAHALQDLAAMLLWGGLGFLAWLAPRELAAAIFPKLTLPMTISVVVLALATLTMLPLQSANLGSGWSDAFSLSIYSDILTATNFSWPWIIALVALATIMLTLRRNNSNMALIASAAAIILVTRALQGHAMMQDGVQGLALQLSYTIHVLCAGAWIGALVPFAIIANSEFDVAMKAQAFKRFSTIGHVFVATVLITGIINTGMILGQPPTRWQTPYQFLLALKLAIVALMIALALLNRYVLLPRAQHSGSSSTLFFTSYMEFVLGLVVLLLINALTSFDPTPM